MRITTVEEKQASEALEQQEQKREPENHQQLLNSDILKELGKITNLVYFVGIIEGIKPLSERVDVLGVRTLDGELVPPVLCQKNEKFIPKIGERLACFGKFKIIKSIVYIQMGEVFFESSNSQ